MARSVEVSKGLSVRQSQGGPTVSDPPANGSVTVAMLSDAVKFGLLPVGAIIPIATHLSGAFSPGASGVVQSGLIRCDGAAIPAGNTLSGNTPNLTGGRFIYGSSGSGVGADVLSGATGGNSSNQATLSSANLPVHTHGLNGSGASAVATGLSALTTHNHTVVYTSPTLGGTTTFPSTSHYHLGTSGVSDQTYLARTNGGTVIATSVVPSGGSNAFVGGTIDVSYTGTPTGGTGTVTISDGSVSNNATNIDHAHTLTGNTTDGGFANTAVSILPQYVAAVYVMRVN